jgi:rod shape-determining protein MreD
MIVTNKVAVRIVLVIFVAILLQNTFFSMVEVFGAPIWILPALAAIFGLLGGSMVGATVGFAVGFLADGLTDGPLGTACLVFMAIGYATGLYREREGQPPTLAAALIAGAATLAASVALGLFTVVLGFDGYLSAAALPDLLLQGLYGFLAAVPLFILIRRILRPALVEERAGRQRRPTVLES